MTKPVEVSQAVDPASERDRPAVKSPIVIRWAEDRDADEVVRLLDVLNAHVDCPTGVMSRDDALRDLTGAERDAETIVADVDGAVLGCAVFFAAYDSEHVQRGFYLLDLAVDPRARRMGLARALIATVAREARRRGRTFVSWHVWPPNKEATGFYDSLGAIAEPMIARALFGDPFDALVADGHVLGPPPERA